MKTFNLKYLSIFACLFALTLTNAKGQVGEPIRLELAHKVDSVVRLEVSVGRVAIDSIIEKDKAYHIYFNANLSYYPMRTESVNLFSELANKVLANSNLTKNKVRLYTDGHEIAELIPHYYKKKSKSADRFYHKNQTAHVRNISKIIHPQKGLNDRHIALWQSHGYYYEPKLSRWEWQRARIFQTVEDLYTQSYVLPFLVPMLESAGATVYLPRERDTQKQEIIVDNDGGIASGNYLEFSGLKAWNSGVSLGFAHLKRNYQDNENPFKLGSYRQTETITKGDESFIEWQPTITKEGTYAVYISYHSLPNSTDDALYAVYHKGGVTEFKVNQQMGGGTWIYLGTFDFTADNPEYNKIKLSNLASKKGKVITADAIKIGGGMGNIARSPKLEDTDSKLVYPYEVSGYPRFTEAARYWMQWAGVPDSIYSPSKGINDYTDDYQSRGLWVNYLAGGSMANPEEGGLGIPIDLAFAFHTDAGTTFNDSIIGTLGIFRTGSYDGKYENGASRYLARDLNDLIQSQIVDDIRNLYHPKWTRRGMWNKSYSEASTPRVPTMLLELLSHQNFADMQYGLDPRFRFTVSRAIYKGMLKYLASQYLVDYVVQPLPVQEMSAVLIDKNKVNLSWTAVEDKLEPTAKPTSYIVYTRIGDGAFDKGVLVKDTHLTLDIPQGVVLSFKVTAWNEGGESFPSEILSVGKAIQEKGNVLVINGFTRISAPDDFVVEVDSLAGFVDVYDSGVPYLQDISYIGAMKEFRRTIPWMDDDASGFGDSYSDFETEVIAGNSFDYPAVHGASILKAGFSFSSSSLKAVEAGHLKLSDYTVVDLILGKQKQTKMGAKGSSELMFKTFTNKLQMELQTFTEQGGALLISGSYIASDLVDNPLTKSIKEDKEFLENILKLKWRVNRAAKKGLVKGVASLLSSDDSTYSFNQALNPTIYAVESPDAIEPADKHAFTVMRYSENNLSAGVAYEGDYKVFTLGFPLETITEESQRDQLMKNILFFLKGIKE